MSNSSGAWVSGLRIPATLRELILISRVFATINQILQGKISLTYREECFHRPFEPFLLCIAPFQHVHHLPLMFRMFHPEKLNKFGLTETRGEAYLSQIGHRYRVPILRLLIHSLAKMKLYLTDLVQTQQLLSFIQSVHKRPSIPRVVSVGIGFHKMGHLPVKLRINCAHCLSQ